MRRSTIPIWLAHTMPALARPLLKVWSMWSARGGQPHWLLRQLKSDLGVRVSCRARLLTGQPIYVDPLDSVGGEIVRKGCYEPEAVAVVEALIRERMVVFDIGAHVGQYTLLCGERVGPEGAVHSFEPDPETFEQLVRNVRLNGLQNVLCRQVALGDRVGRAQLHLATVLNIGGNSLARCDDWSGRSVEVELSSVDAYAAEWRIGRVDFIKTDVEGAERAVFEGGCHTLRESKPILLFECSWKSAAFGYGADDVVADVRRLGYEVFLVDRLPLKAVQGDVRAREEMGTEWYNVLALTPAQASAAEAVGLLKS